ncbi:hypothetical protein KUH32_11660 [Thalassococcus sp. CAU 1522]|uniref:Uncharacterized protein n=1 Tax=Thalassococcus arenae TaxID=2851652 RepID=A0ABS6N9E7_9RHOB|nr:hypothetical protein [Thalassococcus arenae]MBV2360433.1 hypothetical protein [Thalassococcus arenae]
MLVRVLILSLLPVLARADPALRAIAWDDLIATPHRVIRFDDLPARPEPGHVIDAPLRAPGLWMGEALQGQITRARDGFDGLSGAPLMPLAVRAGAPGQSLAIALHRGFGSMAVFPLGPAGAQARDGRGEGSAALVFDVPQVVFGLKLHAEYADPLGRAADPGTVTLTFYDAEGVRLARQVLRPGPDVIPLAWTTRHPVAALTIETTDPGGIALDDVVIQTEEKTG